MRGRFPKAGLSLIAVVLIMNICGCSAGPVDAVRNGTLNIDPSVTVGDAFNGYKYFGKKEWKAFKDTQNRQIVEFRGKIDIDKFAGITFMETLLTREMIERAKKKLGNPVFTYFVQFAVSKNGKTFQLIYNGVHVTGKDAKTGKKIDENISLEGLGLLIPSGIRFIYKNLPLPYVVSVLIDNGKM